MCGKEYVVSGALQLASSNLDGQPIHHALMHRIHNSPCLSSLEGTGRQCGSLSYWPGHTGRMYG